MPTYEYACPACGIVEVYQSIKDQALIKCPNCKKAKVHRLISGGGGVIFKGSGFWETDYNRSSDYQKKDKEEMAAIAKSKPESQTDAKPAAKPQTESKPAASPAAKAVPASKTAVVPSAVTA
jgi:putative FmdB family regulatory protein